MCSLHSVSALKSSGWILMRRLICPSSSTLTRSLTRTQGWHGSTRSRFPTLSLRPRRVRNFLYQGTARLNQTRQTSSGPHPSQQTLIVCNFSDVYATWGTLMTSSSTVSDWKGQVHRSPFLSVGWKKKLCCCKIAVDSHRGQYFTHWHCPELTSWQGINNVLINICFYYIFVLAL